MEKKKKSYEAPKAYTLGSLEDLTKLATVKAAGSADAVAFRVPEVIDE